MAEGILFLVLVVMTSCSRGSTIPSKIFDNHEEEDSLHDDIILSSEQKLMMQERGFYTAAKWPLENDLVTVPYYFDATIPSAVKTNFKKAVDIYASQSCIRWVEIPKTDPRKKVKVFRGQGCYSYIGVASSGNILSLGTGCERISTIIHEMGHTMGLFHTQSRPDRDQYVNVWWNNIKPGMEFNFAKSTGDLYDVPYDYKSMMHYGNKYFSKNGYFTLTTVNPFALFAIGSRLDNFRWSDAAFLNRAYTCDKINERKCPGKTCLNGGFVGQDCKCKCPENNKGDRCETVAGEFFADVPKCGGIVTTPREITTFVNGVSVSDNCIFKIVAPKCKLPSITFTYVRLYWSDCTKNQLIVETSSAAFGATFCKGIDVPMRKAIVADKQQAAIYYHTSYQGSTTYGVKANITFVANPSCANPGA